MADEMHSDRTQAEDLALVKRSVSQLAEHFDTVQIVCTRVVGDGTVQVNNGVGNWYARYGSLRDWVIREEANLRTIGKDTDSDE